MLAINKDIKVSAQGTSRFKQMRLECWIAYDHVIDQLRNGGTRNGKFALVINIKFHKGGKPNNRHKDILLRVGCFYVENPNNVLIKGGSHGTI